MKITKLLPRLLLATLLQLVAGCSLYEQPPKGAKSAQLESDDVHIEKVDDKKVISSTVRVYPGKRSVSLFKYGPTGPGRSSVVHHWTVTFDAKEGSAYRFSADGRELHVTDVQEGKTYRLTASGAVPIASPTVPVPSAATMPTGPIARILSASVGEVGGTNCWVRARIQLDGYPGVPFTLRATIVNQRGMPIYPQSPQQYTRTVKTGDDEDTDSYPLALPWDQLSLLGEPCYAKLELLDRAGKVVSTLKDSVDLYTDVRSR